MALINLLSIIQKPFSFEISKDTNTTKCGPSSGRKDQTYEGFYQALDLLDSKQDLQGGTCISY